ncbi:MAG: hypothetical protein JSW67_15515 [Candidatus Latescibacterota bacterium]|nr:MAG: hypothetical protein JSW67_15515 [Candidatus Latescibacterota bacterium]
MHPKRTVLFAMLLLLVASPGAAQLTPPCGDECLLGVFDDSTMTRKFGFWDPTAVPLKELWVGIQFDPAFPNPGVTGVEFGIAGIPAEVSFDVDYPVQPTVVIGDLRAPADTISTGFPGGANIAWPACLEGERILVKLTLFYTQPLPSDLLFRVVRKYPPSNPIFLRVGFTQCDAVFTLTSIAGGCYTLNPSGPPPGSFDGCDAGHPVGSRTWSAIKTLFR